MVFIFFNLNMYILDINECEHQEAYSCYGVCQNLPGSFHCQCPDGTYGNTSIKGGCVTIKNSFTGDMPLRASYYHITCYISLSHLIQKLNIPLDRLYYSKTWMCPHYYFLRFKHRARSWWWSKYFAYSPWWALHNA